MTGDLVRSPAQPVDRLEEVLGLLDELSELARAGEALARRLEAVSGLRTGELQALAAVADGADHPRAVARRTGQVDEAAAVTVGSLVQRGLLGRHRHPASRSLGAFPSLVHLTEAGRVALAQAEGLRIRALASVVRELGDAEADGLRTTVLALGTALAGDGTPGPPPEVRALRLLGA